MTNTAIAFHFLKRVQSVDIVFENHTVTITTNLDGSFSYQWAEPYYYETRRTQQRMRDHMAVDLVRHGFEVQIKHGERKSLREGIVAVSNNHRLELHVRLTDQVDVPKAK